MAVPREPDTAEAKDALNAYYEEHGSPQPISRFYDFFEPEDTETVLEWWPGESEPRRVLRRKR